MADYDNKCSSYIVLIMFGVYVVAGCHNNTEATIEASLPRTLRCLDTTHVYTRGKNRPTSSLSVSTSLLCIFV